MLTGKNKHNKTNSLIKDGEWLPGAIAGTAVSIIFIMLYFIAYN